MVWLGTRGFALKKSTHRRQRIELQHKTLVFMASMIAKAFLMAMVSSQVFCRSIDPTIVFMQCGPNAAFMGGSVAAVALMGIVFGYYIVRLKSFNDIFPQVMKADFIVTAMYLGVAFFAPDTIAARVMMWLFGMWIIGMVLAPFSKERTLFKKITEYGSIAALGGFLALQVIPVPIFEGYDSSSTIGMILSSVLAPFGGGRGK
ncbi:hypothetical protein Ngar_c31170 [Candidatus Nitrososphaera gargensis Ga9.2]|uniref:Uncharacterized protein n=1 Tax=Nitrososphaera gargensis (strain Ga9.2) TaxID=1237085 RepID=K0IKW6_NITGG|nr:hypothetical protein [Candidatus Nitrososphaera gargensis]AFU60033.1 hypothetical protein Ngar_c31170 [Candidatus Nitrososphaera gargensis Ga9.2]